MAKDFKDLIHIFEAVRDALDEVLPQAATSVSLAAKGLAQKTIQERGFGETYSTNEIPIWFMTGRGKSKRGEAFLEAEKKKGRTTAAYYEFRQAEGLQTKFVDLTFSGEMWRGMFPREVEVQGNYYIAPLGCNTKAGQDKLNWQYERYGNFFADVLKGDNLKKMYQVANDEIYRLLLEKIG